ncbi:MULTISPECIES: hypothetical protein [unclassified Sulfurospirillum]|uniref:hypothetical protein n=1 Tax=unclassified Sulfurospirillum TaxID=2618290 RepID=UPI000505B324|nr:MULTISPECIES: hypothetical protein [unclassified Sulfurospirillum]KFL34370.1 hypothetical protein JU57_06300 [Sulfurospirillum sp. SCADC]
MQKKVLGALFLLLFAGVGFFLSKLLTHETDVKEEIVKYEPSKTQEIKQETSQNVWIKEMAHKDAREFIFPVNELFMQIDAYGQKSGSAGKLKSFRLVIDRADRYSLFCIVQTLNALHLPYMVIKEDKIPIIYVEEKSEKQLENVVLELEKYDIKSKIVEVWL